jgi:O-succinylbenzoic acid--CoA ligase
VLHSWANHLYSAKGSNANLPLHSGDRWLLSLPLYHVGGLAILVRCALAGAAVAVPDQDASLSATLDATGATHASLVATQLRRLLEAREALPRRVRGLLLGGGPLPEGLLRRGHERSWPLHTSYGSTEMASQITTTPPGAPLSTLRTAGRRLPHRRLRIDADGQILVAGPTLCLGIAEGNDLHDPRAHGWLPTGDLGRLDAQGRLHVQGRTDRQFISGGENIQPEELEAALERGDRIARAVVVPVPDPEYGRRPVAFLRTTGGPLPEEWRDRLRAELPSFKVPDAAYPLPEAATEGRMKVDRADLIRRAQHLYDHSADAESDA